MNNCSQTTIAWQFLALSPGRFFANFSPTITLAKNRPGDEAKQSLVILLNGLHNLLEITGDYLEITGDYWRLLETIPGSFKIVLIGSIKIRTCITTA